MSQSLDDGDDDEMPTQYPKRELEEEEKPEEKKPPGNLETWKAWKASRAAKDPRERRCEEKRALGTNAFSTPPLT